MNGDNRFIIDFFEFSFLVEACIPPRPIARTWFWRQVIDKYYHVLTIDERQKLYEWINLNPVFKDGIEKGNEDCLLFNYRYNPDNQYVVKTLFKGREESVECFKIGEIYHVNINSHICDEFIIDVQKFEHKIE